MKHERGVTVKILAEAFGVTPRQISNYVDQGMPKLARGRFDERRCWRWRYDRKEAEIRERIDNLDKDEADARKKRLEGDKLEIELRKLRGELFPRDRVERYIERLIQAAKSRMLAFPTKAAARMIGLETMQEARDIMEQEVHQILHDLSTSTIDISDLRSGGSDGSMETPRVDAPTPADAKPVGRRKGHALRRRKRRARKVQSRSS